MSFLDQIGGLLSNISSGNLNEQEMHAHYDQIANAVPPQTLGAVIGPALQSLGMGQAQQGITNSAQQMTPAQRGGLMGQLLGAFGNSGVNTGSLLSQLGINPAVASNPQSATPQEVAALASHAQANNPSIFQEGMAFYSQHPTLVKALGTAAITEIASHLGRSS
jgi:hypothetical protein